MEKRTTKAFNTKIYLLGRCKEDGKNVWLEEPSWDCGWYWGFGYLEKYTNNNNPSMAKDIISHSHFDSTFFNREKCAYDTFIDYFEETTLRPDEIWLLLDYMHTFYALRKVADIFHSGSSHYTSRAEMELLKDADLYNHINKEILPTLFKRIDTLLGGNKNEKSN